MSAGVIVLGSLGSTNAIGGDADALPERHPVGTAVELAVCLARAGLGVELVAAVDEPVDASLRAPLAAEGIELVPVEWSSSSARDDERAQEEAWDPAAAPASLPPIWEDALRSLRRRDGLVVVPDVPARVLSAALDPVRRLADHRTAVLVHPTDLDPRRLAPVDLIVAQLAAARRLVRSDAEVGVRGVARRLAAYGPKRVVVLDDGPNGRSVHFDGTDLMAVRFAGDQGAGGGRLTVFAAAMVAARVGGDARIVGALAEATRCAALPDAEQGAFPSLPTTAQIEGEPNAG